MAQLLSTTVSGVPQRGAFPQSMQIVQEFDSPVYVTDDFFLEFGGNYPGSPGGMIGRPVQFVPTQLSYTVFVSPFSRGRLGVIRQSGQITDIFGDPVDLLIGQDYDIYNVDLYPYFKDPKLLTPWETVMPSDAICLYGNTNPGFEIRFGPFPRPVLIEDNIWQNGNFFLWYNYAWKPDQSDEGIPFSWTPPFYYSWSGFGTQLTSSYSGPVPPVDATTRFNVCSSGNDADWDTCGWVNLYPRWRGKLQVWVFGSDIFEQLSVPWQFPAVAQPTGDLNPSSILGFDAAGVPTQVYIEKAFTYTL